MAEEAPESETVHVKSEVPDQELPDDIESQIQQAMHSRISHFKDQANSLTFEGVRRLLEKDLVLETYALDVHKRFIKQCLLKCLEGVSDDDLSKHSGEAEEKTTSRENETEPVEKTQSNKEIKECCPDGEEKMEDSPVLGLLKTQKSVKTKTRETEEERGGAIPSDITIKKAIRKRIPYIKANSEKLTMAGFRRLLEEDLKLDNFTLDPCKKFISQQLDEVLQSIEVPEPKTNGKKITKKAVSKAAAEASSEEGSESSAEDSDSEEEEVETKPRKKMKGTTPKSDGLKKRKTSAEEINLSKNKRMKRAKAPSENDTDQEDGGNDSEDDQSESIPEKPAKKKEVLAPAYGKRVEHLKSIIKACGMSVPPSVYKKVKQVPENKREAHLVKELEEILSREGLSSNPSEKEIKDVRRKKERARELEGIDVSNIVSSSRRRSTSSFAAPPKPKVQVEKVEDAEDSDDEDDDNNDNDDEEEEDEEADNSDDGNSQSEEDDEE